MNKRLTDRERNALKRWLDNPESKPEELSNANLSTLIGWVFESEQSAWEEVERLRKMYEREREIAEQMKTAAETLKEENEHFRLHHEVQQSWSLHMIEGQIKMGEEIERLQAQLQDALKVMQEAIDDIDCEYPQTARISLRKAIQRIQEGER
ncbi:hypothetical protein PDENDC454_04284 [Paenibacillus dendritiformis C454]|uniref:Uncharacterized protein n=1 Tax=Paenibacillus dendritiformis C454 TaxID=1131935 RepID=H3SBH1_9BACL|nr:hypothetical protein [Paenibacillus dendritiformis]EHQ63654.1 hypothetical protein PDENDC454_04284 [Paenibacillus dendritiformis C454]